MLKIILVNRDYIFTYNEEKESYFNDSFGWKSYAQLLEKFGEFNILILDESRLLTILKWAV